MKQKWVRHVRRAHLDMKSIDIDTGVHRLHAIQGSRKPLALSGGRVA